MHDFDSSSDKFPLHPNPPPDDNDEVVDPENLALDLEHLANDNVLNSNPEWNRTSCFMGSKFWVHWTRECIYFSIGMLKQFKFKLQGIV